MHPNPRKIIPIFLLVVAIGAAYWYFSSQRASAGPLDLDAAGTIETTLIQLAAEAGGRIAAVLVDEGQPVEAGQVLVRFEHDVLDAQLEQARAAVQTAQANYDLVAAGVPAEQQRAAVTRAELELLQAQQALDTLHDQAELNAARARQALAVAEKELDRATQALDNLESRAPQADIDAAAAAVVLAKKALDDALEDFRPYEKKAEDNVIRAQLQTRVASAQKNYDAAVTRLNNITGTSNEYDLELARAAQVLALAQVADARREAETLHAGPDPDLLAVAQARREAAEAALQAARAEPTDVQLAVARAQLDQARAALALLQTQLSHTEIKAPVGGVVLSRLVEPGEMVGSGGALLTLADLESLSITVYIPEDQYGTISLGQPARVSVDSYPGQTFDGRVIHIADEAEFTPRNVSTAEGRRTTVFAVRLAVENPHGSLKPGMPADVSFD
jgi:HlyD family secretion protein